MRRVPDVTARELRAEGDEAFGDVRYASPSVLLYNVYPTARDDLFGIALVCWEAWSGQTASPLTSWEVRGWCGS